MMKTKIVLLLPLLTLFSSNNLLDIARFLAVFTPTIFVFEQMLEDQTTIEKASKLIQELSGKEMPSLTTN